MGISAKEVHEILQHINILKSGFDNIQHFFQYLSVILDTRDLALSSQFPLRCKPCMKSPLRSRMYYWFDHQQIIRSFAFIMAICFLESLIQMINKHIHISRFLHKFYNPFMHTSGCFSDKLRSYSVFFDDHIV